MSESDAPAGAPAPALEPRPHRRVAAPSLVSVVLALLLVLLAWSWVDSRRELRKVREQVSKRLEAADNEARESRAIAKRAEDEVGASSTLLKKLEEQASSSKNQQLALEQLYNERSRGTDEWMLAEIEASLNIAAQQLQLAGNVQAALFAVETADARLALVDRPRFTKLRAQFVKDMNALKAVPNVDMTGIVLRLDRIVASVDDMTLLADGRPQPAAEAAAQGTTMWSRLGELVWNEIRQLVRVQRLDRADQALLTPEAASYLRENLKLRLLGARVALLQRNDAVFKSDVASARAALAKYFDVRQKDVGVAVATLTEFERTSLDVRLPALAESIAEVRSLRRSIVEKAR